MSDIPNQSMLDCEYRVGSCDHSSETTDASDPCYFSYKTSPSESHRSFTFLVRFHHRANVYGALRSVDNVRRRWAVNPQLGSTVTGRLIYCAC